MAALLEALSCRLRSLEIPTVTQPVTAPLPRERRCQHPRLCGIGAPPCQLEDDRHPLGGAAGDAERLEVVAVAARRIWPQLGQVYVR
jgi:hypothetical protein